MLELRARGGAVCYHGRAMLCSAVCILAVFDLALIVKTTTALVAAAIFAKEHICSTLEPGKYVQV